MVWFTKPLPLLVPLENALRVDILNSTMTRKSKSQLKVKSNSESGNIQPKELPPQSWPFQLQSLPLLHQLPQSTTMMRNPDTHGLLTAPPLKVKPNMLTARTQNQQLSKSFMDHPTPISKILMLLTLQLCILKTGASEMIPLKLRKSAQMLKHHRFTLENMPGKRTTATPQNSEPPTLSARIMRPGKTSKSFMDHPTHISNNFTVPPTPISKTLVNTHGKSTTAPLSNKEEITPSAETQNHGRWWCSEYIDC